MVEYTNQEAIDFHFQVLNAIGISIRNGTLVDQDTGAVIMYEGKPIVYSYDENKPVFDTEDAVKLDLINNMKMATNLFGYYLNKIVADPDHEAISVDSFYQTDDADKGKSALNVRYVTEDGKVTVQGRYFFNNVLKYPALILAMEGNPFELQIDKFDDPELAKGKYGRK